jgi:hypothetical protein
MAAIDSRPTSQKGVNIPPEDVEPPSDTKLAKELFTIVQK